MIPSFLNQNACGSFNWHLNHALLRSASLCYYFPPKALLLLLFFFYFVYSGTCCECKYILLCNFYFSFLTFLLSALLVNVPSVNLSMFVYLSISLAGLSC